jgi:hypothetical protein
VSASEKVKIYPCACPEGHYLMDVPPVAQEVSAKEAERLVASQAFTFDPKGQHPAPAEDKE